MNTNFKTTVKAEIKAVVSVSALFLALTLSSCGDDPKRKCYSCDEAQKKSVQEFITTNTKSANNMSDEEMEDVISELRETAIKTICNQKYMKVDGDGNIQTSAKDTLNYYRFYSE
jgi:folate-dependent phosphoribosylglycinamide formyltransferase PurN